MKSSEHTWGTIPFSQSLDLAADSSPESYVSGLGAIIEVHHLTAPSAPLYIVTLTDADACEVICDVDDNVMRALPVTAANLGFSIAAMKSDLLAAIKDSADDDGDCWNCGGHGGGPDAALLCQVCGGSGRAS